MATELDVVLKLIAAVGGDSANTADPRRMFQLLMSVAVAYADEAGICAQHFVEFATKLWGVTHQPMTVRCTKCRRCGLPRRRSRRSASETNSIRTSSTT